MSGLILSAEDRAYFLRMMRRQRNSAVHRRMNVLPLLDDGWEPRQIAEALYADEGTVTERRHRYEREGRGGIERLDYRGRVSLLGEEQQAQLSSYVDARVPLTSKEACSYAVQAFGSHRRRTP